MPSDTLSITAILGDSGTGKTHALIRELYRQLDEEGVPAERLTLLCQSATEKKTLLRLLANNTPSPTDYRYLAVHLATFDDFCLRLAEKAGDALIPLGVTPPGLQKVSLAQASLVFQQLAQQQPCNSDHPISTLLQHPDMADLAVSAWHQLIPVASLTTAPPCNATKTNLKTWQTGDEPLATLSIYWALLDSHLRQQGWLLPNHLLTLAGQWLQRLSQEPTLQQNPQQPLPQTVLVDNAHHLSEYQWQLLKALSNHCQLILAGNPAYPTAPHPNPLANLRHHFGETARITLQPDPYLSARLRPNDPLALAVHHWLAGKTSPLDVTPPLTVGQAPTLKLELALVAKTIAQLQQTATASNQPYTAAVVFRNATQRNEALESLAETFALEGLSLITEAPSQHLFGFRQFLFHAISAILLLCQLPKHPPDDGVNAMDYHQTLQAMNTHMYQWLQQDETLGLPSEALDRLTPTSNIPLLQQLEGFSGHPKARQAYQGIMTIYQHYTQHQNLSALGWQLLNHQNLLTHLDEDHQDLTQTPAPEALGKLLNALAQMDEALAAVAETPLTARGFQTHFSQLCEAIEKPAIQQQADEAHTTETEAAPGAVSVLTAHELLHRSEYDAVFVVGCTANHWPLATGLSPFEALGITESLSEALQETPPNGMDWPQERQAMLIADGIQREKTQQQEAALLGECLNRATQMAYISLPATTSSEQGGEEPTLPSPFVLQWLQLLDSTDAGKRLEAYSEGHAGWFGQSPCKVAIESTGKEKEPLWQANDWTTLAPQSQTLVFDPTETLELSHSGLESLMQCPRKYYYTHLLRLRRDDGRAAIRGTLTHRLMEIFHQQLGTIPYTAQSLIHLAKTLLITPLSTEESPFTPEDLAQVATLTELERTELGQWLEEAFTDLAAQGFFEMVPVRALNEQSFEFELDSIPSCRFRGKIDALLQDEEGHWRVVDYKTGVNDFIQKQESNRQAALLRKLAPLPQTARSHQERFDGDERSYQLPLYYLATQNSAMLASKMGGSPSPAVKLVGLQFVRPNHGKAGSVAVQLDATTLKSHLNTVMEDIKTYLIEPLRATPFFETTPRADTCRLCDFQGICDAVASDDEAEAL